MNFYPNSQNDVFRTQADTRFNSFADPQNPINQNSGDWGIDSNYLTPSYASPFRPQYQGPNGMTYGNHTPGYWRSMNEVFNPFAPGMANYGGNTWRQQTPFYDSITNRPMDNAMSFAQNWAVPGAAAFFAYKYWGKASTAIGAGLGRGLLAGASRGLSPAVRGSWAATGATLGGFAGNVFLPMLAAQGAVEAFDSAVMDPYIAQRTMGRTMRDNFAGVTFAGAGVGDPFTGGGLSRRMAQQIAKNVSISTAKDMTFTQQEGALLTDYATRAGLMDSAGGDQLSQRFESILKSVKTVMSVANTADFKETIEIMAQLSKSGINLSQINQAGGMLSALSAAGGQSMLKVLNTVGAQGQYMFGAAGLTPYVGIQSAFTSNAAMAAAHRSGLISNALMARMGGVEGATQSAVAAGLAAYQTPYANIMAHNAFFNGGSRNSVVGNLAAFGNHIAEDPFTNIGNHQLMAGALSSRHLQERGLMGEQDQLFQIANNFPIMRKAIREGKLSAGAAYMIMTTTMQMTREQALAKLKEFAAYGDKGTVDTMLAGQDRSSIDASLKYMQQERLDKGIFTTPYNAVYKHAQAVQVAGAGIVGGMLESLGDWGDKFQEFWNQDIYRIKNPQIRGTKFEDLKQTPATKATVFALQDLKATRLKNRAVDQVGMAEKLNKLAREGDADAITAISATGLARDNALFRLARKGKIDAVYNTPEAIKRLTEGLDTLTKYDVDLKPEDTKTLQSTLGSALNKVLEGATPDQAADYINVMAKIRKDYGMGKDLDEKDVAKVTSLLKDKDGLSHARIVQLAKEAGANAAAFGVGHIEGFSGLGSLENYGKALKDKGYDVLMPGVAPSNDFSAMAAQSDVQVAIAKQRARIVEFSKNMKIDTSTMMGSLNALDNQTAVGAFSDAVTRFSQAVDKSGKDVPPQSPHEQANKVRTSQRVVRQ